MEDDVMRDPTNSTEPLAPHQTTDSDTPRGASPDHAQRRLRKPVGVLTTILSIMILWFALLVPSRLSDLTPTMFPRLPLVGVVFLVLLVTIRAHASRTRAVVAVSLGGMVAVLTVLRFFDVAFHEALGRAFHPVVDWPNVVSGASLLINSAGGVRGVALIAFAAGTLVVVLVGLPLATLRVARSIGRNRHRAGLITAVLTTAWAGMAVGNVQLGGVPVASTDVALYAYRQARAIPEGIRDQREFAVASSSDPLLSIPDDRLLSALRGKDVLFVFVESYGRVALEDTKLSGDILTLLDSESERLLADGFDARSAFLTSPTFGGVSWLAHSTFQSGLWVDSKPRYDVLLASDRLTLSHAFRRTGWRTVVDVPANVADWDRGDYYAFETFYDSRNVGYEGPRFGYAPVPDQYTLEAFQRLELADPGGPPVMAEIDLVSSHGPWSPLPPFLDSDKIGDGSVYADFPQSPSPTTAKGTRDAYAASIEYSLRCLFAFVADHADDDTVVVFLGDHQPSTVVSGSDSGKDVPITILTRDTSVLDGISAWNWDIGLAPGANAPVTRMDTFRDAFLEAFSS